MRKSGPSNKRNDSLAAVMAALLWGPKTRISLREITGVTESTVDFALEALHQHGLAYRSGIEPANPIREDGTRSAGQPRVLWAFNTTPFANTDTVTHRGRPLPKEPDHVNRSIS